MDRVRVGRYRAADDRRVLADDKAMESALGLVVGSGHSNHRIHRYHTRENQFRHPHACTAQRMVHPPHRRVHDCLLAACRSIGIGNSSNDTGPLTLKDKG